MQGKDDHFCFVLYVTHFTPPNSHAAEVEDGSFAEDDW